MPNVIQLRGRQHQRSALPPSKAGAWPLDLEMMSPVVMWRTTVAEEVRRSVLLLDLAAQRVRLIAAKVVDEQLRQTLTVQIDALEQRLEVAREMARRL
jgi:hypothetical protein